MRHKKLVVSLLVLLAFVVSGFTYAFWAGQINVAAIDNQQQAITIGAGETVSTTASVGTIGVVGADLVPSLYIDEVGDDTAVITIPVTWTTAQGASGAMGTLVVSNPVLSATGLTEGQLNAMFSVTLTTNNVSIANGATQSVVITVVFAHEPATKDIYDLLQVAGEITLTVSLVINPAA
jgi:hypothetical protein